MRGKSTRRMPLPFRQNFLSTPTPFAFKSRMAKLVFDIETSALPIDHFDGLGASADLPRDGRCVRDYWF